MPKDEFDPEDPMEMVGVEVEGSDPDEALESFVQEYLFMGWKPALIFFLFRSPHYAATHQIYRIKGHDYVKQRIDELTEKWNSGWLAGGVQNA